MHAYSKLAVTPSPPRKSCTWKDVDKYMWCVTPKDLRDLKKQLKEAIKEGTLKPDKDSEHYNEEIDGVYFDNPEKWDPSVYKVMDDFIKPGLLELDHSSSWALERHPEGLECEIFATHAWAEGIFEFINSALGCFRGKTKNMYVCFLANPQDETSLHELILDPKDSPFAEALAVAKYFVVIPTTRTCIYERLWCVYEIFLALKRIREDGDLKIKMRWVRNKWAVAMRAVLMLVFFCTPAGLLSFFLLAPKVGFAVGPLMWLMLFHLLGSFVWFSIHMFGNRCLRHQHPHDIPECELKLMIAWTYTRLALAGIAGGLALYDLLHNHTQGTLAHGGKKSHLHLRWAPGEEESCMIVFITFSLMYIYDLLLTMVAEIVHREGGKLDRFKTVEDAKCYSDDDANKIWDEIGRDQEEIDEIDEAINDLRVLGKYDADVLFNLRLGMTLEVIRQGINPFQILCGVSAWVFWLVTDLNGRGWKWAPITFVLLLSLLGVLLVYGRSSCSFNEIVPDEKFIFAVTSFMWTGIAYLVVSNHSAFYDEESALKHRMFVSSLPVLLLMMCVLFCLNACYYCGIFASVKRKMFGTTGHDHESVKKQYESSADSSSCEASDDEKF